ncbi:T9SS type A sorting domain-containing protein [Kaistella carnis]|uniref:T9SS type A sorting domain-containing protein n=1 Tax=Kaistella carnis TaxID=1241979 RepID=UPI0028ACD6A4|nr:T9SS type A sorting domain-containing protein [Kaistella carnis]
MKQNLFSLMILCGSLMSAQSYSNGNLSTGATTSTSVAAPAGYTWSEIQAANTTYGVAGYSDGTNVFRLSDDFTVPAGESWAISSVEVFAYQTGSTVFPISQMNLVLWNGSPAAGGTVAFGDPTTNIINVAGSSDSKMYRVAASAVGTTRRIWQVKANVAKSLNPGTYWVDYQLKATNSGAVFLPPVTIVGSNGPADANAIQANGGVWAPVLDGGSGVAQAMPFIITYVATTLGTTETRQLDSRVVVYPNPTADSFKLSLPLESKNSKTEVSIYDVTGKKVKSFKMADSYNVSDLQKGMYLIKVNDGQNIKATKLIKN